MSCQLQYLSNIKEKNLWFNYMRWYANVFLRGFYRHLTTGKLKPTTNANKNDFSANEIHIDQIEAGDIVKVRSQEEIKETLNSYNKTRGCGFRIQMYDDCGKEFVVHKKVNYFFDEAKQKICRCNNIYLLKGSCCCGCDRHCFLFWHASWLKKA